MVWPLAKLDVINQALALTANAPVAVVNDGSDEWTVGDAAYESALEAMFEEHDWGFLTNIQTLQRAGTPTDPLYTDAYNLPPDCMHLIWVRITDNVTLNPTGTHSVEYQIVNNQIFLNAYGTTPPPPPNATPGTVQIKYVSNSNGPDKFTPLFMKAMRFFVMSGIYRGLNEDFAEANQMYAAGVAAVQEARARADQQGEKKAMHNSRILGRRRTRSPSPPTPAGWTGTGIPG